MVVILAVSMAVIAANPGGIIDNAVMKKTTPQNTNGAPLNKKPPIRKRHVREGWAESSKALAESGDDALVWPEFKNLDDDKLIW